MDIKDLKETPIWELYMKSVNFMHLRKIYTDTDVNYRMYNGDQWAGLKIEGVEKIQHNFIKQIVKQKTSRITSNLFAVNYSPENIETQEFMETAKEACDLLNKKASKVFDKDFIDKKIKKWVKQAAINDEAVCYIYYDFDGDIPKNEIIAKNDIMYGNENEDEIQFQPYILIRQRKTVTELRELAKDKGKNELEIATIIGDNDTATASGESAKDELEDKCWLVTKFYKKDGKVYWSQTTKYCTLVEDKDLGIELYPIAHFNWEDQEGNARGVGEVRQLIPNQIEANKTAMRRALSTKNTAYPQKVVNEDLIQNIKDVNKIGTTIRFKDAGGTRANDVFMTTTPAQMSPDSEKLQSELINLTKDLNNVSDATTGNINPESASGKAILAVQNAQNTPLNDQTVALSAFIEEIARIWLQMWKKYSKGLKVETEEVDPMTQEPTVVVKEIPMSVLDALEASVKVDITPRGAFDKYAQEISIENLFTTGKITFEEYVKSLDTDSVMPKVKLEQIVKDRQEAQEKIQQAGMMAQQMKNQMLEQSANQQDINGIAQEGQNIANQMLQAQPMA